MKTGFVITTKPRGLSEGCSALTRSDGFTRSHNPSIIRSTAQSAARAHILARHPAPVELKLGERSDFQIAAAKPPESILPSKSRSSHEGVPASSIKAGKRRPVGGWVHGRESSGPGMPCNPPAPAACRDARPNVFLGHSGEHRLNSPDLRRKTLLILTLC